MALNKRTGMDLKAIARDQKAIDALPNKGRASIDHSKSSAKKKEMAKKIKTYRGIEMPSFGGKHKELHERAWKIENDWRGKK